MKVKCLGSFKSNLLKPCKKLLRFFVCKKCISIKPLNCFHRNHNTAKPPRKKGMRSKFLSVFSSKKRDVHVEDIGELGSSVGGRTEGRGGSRLLYPSPLTPAFLNANKSVVIKEDKGEAEAEDACRSFENYMVEMIVEEGKMRDLMDVEELLYCWKNLKCPVYKNLVCRFYGELCQDLFSSEGDEWKY
ncbi:hypothetical protein ACHQM5_023329 [Ranunculus cassubicifolius]